MYIADFHIHSRYSYATSKTCTLEYLDLWARRKGIHIVGTGDFTHPAWRAELKKKLAPAEDGLYILKEEYRLYDEADGKKIDAYGRGQKEMIPRFIISGEISSVYKKEGRSRNGAQSTSPSGFCRRQSGSRIVFHRLEISVRTVGRHFGLTVGTFLNWRLTSVGIRFIFRLIYGRRIFRYSESFRDLKRPMSVSAI